MSCTWCPGPPEPGPVREGPDRRRLGRAWQIAIGHQAQVRERRAAEACAGSQCAHRRCWVKEAHVTWRWAHWRPVSMNHQASLDTNEE